MLRYLMKSAVCAAAIGLAASPAALAQNLIGVNITEPGDSAVTQKLHLGIDKSTVIDLPRPVADVVITNAGIADAVVQTTERLIFRGITTGETNAFLYDENGLEILSLEITVDRDLAGLREAIARHLPGSRVDVESMNGSVVLTGGVESQAQNEQVVELVTLYTQGAEMMNLIDVAAGDQVLLEVRVVEMSRSFLKQLGINPQADIGFGDLANLTEQQLFVDDGFGNSVDSGTTALAPGPPFSNQATTEFGGVPSTDGFNTTLGYTNFVQDELQAEFGLNINALERVGVARTLAEPNLTALSGETASFLAGGEFPVPSPPTATGQVGIEFREFGVGLGFTPLVLSEDRIALNISAAVSELSANGSVGGVPALTTREVDTTVELPSGRSMMIAGLIQSRTRQELDQFPGLKEVPILGTLFQSRDFANDETELVIIVTPYIVDPASRSQLRTPADGFANPSDLQTVLFGKLNRQYADGEVQLDAESYRAPIGFMQE